MVVNRFMDIPPGNEEYHRTRPTTNEGEWPNIRVERLGSRVCLMTLNERLMAIRCELEASTDPHELSLTREADAALLASGILDRALKAGDSAPEFTLNDASGRPVALSKELRAGPVVVCFYRGEWCPFCALQLTALNETYPDIRGLGAQLLAISPQARSSHRSGHFKPELAFPRLEDVGSAVAKAFGIAFPLASESRPLYG
jgi:peroxiredoxin